MDGNGLSAASFASLRQLIRDASGFELLETKSDYAALRLQPLVQQERLPSLDALVSAVRFAPTNGLHERVVEAVLNNETSFFRDLRGFTLLKDLVLPELLKRSPPSEIRVWSAACSTGQEPYSLAMLLRESLPPAALRWWRLMASDLSQSAIARAREGSYSQFEINRGLPATRLVRWFSKAGDSWRVSHELRAMVDFRRVNLARDEVLSMPSMDVVLLRNVLIYFDSDARRDVLRRVQRVLRPGGWLLLGGAEAAIRAAPGFEFVGGAGGSIYRRTQE